MTGSLFEISFDDLELSPRAPLAVLQGIAARAVDLGPALDEIGGMVATSTRIRFEDGVGPDGEAWPESARAEAESGQTLVDTGRLRDSITHSVDGDSVRVGTALIYAGIHQFGGVIEGKAGPLTFSLPGGGFAQVESVEIPARPFLGFNDADQAEAALILEEHLLGDLDGGAR